jgi:hypothetical protein
VHVDIDRTDRGEEVFHGLQSIAGLGVVLDVVLDDQIVEGVDVPGSEGVEDASHGLLVLVGGCHNSALLDY